MRKLFMLMVAVLCGSYTLAAEEESRSEEHTSELQSQCCISYAVFCLKRGGLSHLAS